MTSLIYPRYPVILGLLVIILLLLIGVGAILSLVITPLAGGPTPSIFSTLDIGRVIYSIKSAGIQATLSTTFSILLAIPVSIAAARRVNWLGMNMFIMTISLAMVLPTVVAAMGLLAVWGRSGIIKLVCDDFFDFSIYGMHGVVLAHMMLNVPLAVRVMIPLLKAVPPTKWRLCSHLGMFPYQRFCYVEWPAIRGAIPGLSSLIFLLCFTSFGLVLMLGGGPKVTTLEVEIYSALRFDFNIVAAAGLSLIQFLISAFVVFGSTLLGGVPTNQYFISETKPSIRFDLSRYDFGFDIGVIMFALVIVTLPVIMIGINGLNSGLVKLFFRPQFWDALIASISVALISSVVVTFLSLVIAFSKAGLSLPHRHGNMYAASYLRALMDQGVMLYLVIPSVVLGTAAFIILRSQGDVFGYAFSVLILANTLLALPFAYKLLDTRMVYILSSHDRLAAQLGISGIDRLSILTLPALRQDIGVVAGFSAALSFGDFGVIALFANADFSTLPWLLYQLAGKYAADEANALALVLLTLTVLMFLFGRYAVGKCLGGRFA